MHKCYECRKKISSKAHACPNCGAPIDMKASSQKGAKEFMSGCLALVVFVVVVLICSGVVTSSDSGDRPRKSRHQESKRSAPKDPPAPAVSQEDLERYLDLYLEAIALTGTTLVDSVRVRTISSSIEVTVTVRNAWHVRHKQVRLQDAQALWRLWASIASPDNPDRARLKLVDLMGNSVGGSGWLAGSLVSVKD